MLKTTRALHDLFGLLFSLVLCVTGVTGIILNHRDMLFARPSQAQGGNDMEEARKPPTLLVPGGRPGIVFRLADGKLLATRDGGAAWTEVPTRPEGVAAAAFAPDEPETLYVASKYAVLQKSTDGGQTWIELHTPIQQGDRATTITDMAAGPGGSLTVALSKGGYVYRSAEGEPWIPIQTPAEPPPRERGGMGRSGGGQSLVLALHDGTILGEGGRLLVDAGAATLLLLSATGWWMSWKFGLLRRLRKRERTERPVAL